MRATREARPPALLADATWYGTLAAARDLGSRGVPVTLATDAFLAPARWSRHVDRTVSCPPTRDPARFLAWLRDFGRREPGHVLYPTSDDCAWIVSAHREELARQFRLFSPPLESLARLLDKSRLAADARAAGLDVPETRCPSSEGEVERAGREMAFPIFIKPRTQVMLAEWTERRKGSMVERRQDLLREWRANRRGLFYHPQLQRYLGRLDLPVLQSAHPCCERVYTVDGFVDESGEIHVARACTKLLQLPRSSGPGICFEDAPLDPAVAAGLRRLCGAVGFFGVFDAEFLVEGARRLLIDFNPRFYNHMAFEVDRGMPLPWLAYLAACGDRATLQRAAEEARADAGEARAYVHRFPTRFMLAVQALTGAMDAGKRRSLRRWIRAHRGRVTDPARAAGDRLPAFADAAMNIAAFARHPRAYLRQLAWNGKPRPAPVPVAPAAVLSGGRPAPRHGAVALPARVALAEGALGATGLGVSAPEIEEMARNALLDR